MGTLRLLAVAVVMVACPLSLRAVDYGKEIVGTWEVTKADKDGNLSVGAVVEFADGGKVKVTTKKDGKEETTEGTYKADGDIIEITLKGSGEAKKFKLRFGDKSGTELELGTAKFKKK